MKKAAEKTNALRMLSQHKLAFEVHDYSDSGAVSGTEVAAALGEDPEKVFKTLVTVGKSGQHYVFVVPVCRELDLKKAAAAVKEKNVVMIPQKELLPLTGYIHGGCSPIGMKKLFPTVLHESAGRLATFCVSGGRIGLQLELTPEALGKLTPYTLADIVTEEES
ncbi:MAG: Cys-tRNA(Pro) deacylase [Oscillospiraceae bacterium]|nr:Cys-tRNA(Pro) deacylase [Oscillospiraceae bacterium]